MALCAVAKPNPEVNFNGLIGVWFFTEKGLAVRTSHNRAKGAEVLKLVSADGEKWADMMVQNVFPAIRRKMGWAKEVTVQLDNAR